MWVICRVWFWVAVRIAHSCDFCGGFAFDIDGWMRNWRERERERDVHLNLQSYNVLRLHHEVW